MGNKIQQEFEKHAGDAGQYLSHRFIANGAGEPMLEISYGPNGSWIATLLDAHGFWHAAAKLGERAREIAGKPREMMTVQRGPDSAEVESELYLRDGFPFAVAAKVQLRDGRIGIGVARQDPFQPGALGLDAMDARAREDALENMPGVIIGIDHGIPGGIDATDLQAKLGQPAREG